MPSKEIKALRQEGRLDAALEMARAELMANPDSVWAKRNLSWVLYDWVKKCNSLDEFDSFLQWLEEIKTLGLGADEHLFYEQLCWPVGQMAFALSKLKTPDKAMAERLFESVKILPFYKPSEGYSFLFKAFHKCFKELDGYLNVVDWLDLNNLSPADYEKEVLPDRKELMPLAEQIYIAYAKNLLPERQMNGEEYFDRSAVEAFLPKLSAIIEAYPHYQYPAYYKAKLLLALGDKENMLSALIPFARKKRNDFWVWEVLSEAFTHDQETVFACYCKALICKSPEEMLINIRQKMAEKLIARGYFNEARAEIERLVKARQGKGYPTPGQVINWQNTDWFRNATPGETNLTFYKLYAPMAEALLYSDVPEEIVLVEFVNRDKNMLNFIASDTRFGFFKYDRFLKDVKIGDTLKVRFQSGTTDGLFKILTAVKENDEAFRSNYIREVSGTVKIPSGKTFGFIDDVFIHPSLVSKLKLFNGAEYSGMAIKAYNKEKKQWTWKLYH
jgi:hypothetical protein